MAESFNRRRLARLALAAALASSLCAQAAINLDLLTACDDIAKLQEFLRAAAGKKPGNCRAPRGELERALQKRTGLRTNQLCFQASAPVRSLKDFSCVLPEVPTGASLLCFREGAISDVKAYKEQYGEKFAAPVSRYLASASKCSASNGDSSTAVASGFPPLLAFIARFEFAFISLLGKQRLTDSSAIHGYAATDPSIQGGAPSAIEFFSQFVGATEYTRAGERKTVGEWTAYIDDNGTADENANREFRRRNASLMIDATTYNLERETAVSLSQGAKLALLEEFQKAIARSFEEEGFKLVSDAELKEKSGRTSEETVVEISKNMAFGARDIPVKLGPTFLVLVNERQPQCARGGDGAMAAYLLSTQPIPEVRSDYGSVGLIIAGLGTCSRTSSTITRTYVKGLIEEANDQMLKALARH